MTGSGDKSIRASRRGFLAGAAGLALAGSGRGVDAAEATAEPTRPATEPFWGAHQGGIATAQQAYTYFAALDVAAKSAGEVADLMRTWTAAAARMTRGETARPVEADLSLIAGDSGEALDLAAARLTLTFGFGPTLFVKDGKDRFGWGSLRPDALAELPKFNGDQLQPDHSGGDLSIQACADDPQIAFHAVRQLVRLAYGAATPRGTEAGFAPAAGDNTPRNLMGFKDGTQQPKDLDAAVWVSQEGPDWMRGGSYLVVRKIRIALEHWDSHAGRFSGADDRPSQIFRRPARRQSRIRSARSWRARRDRQARHSSKRPCADGGPGDQRRRPDPSAGLLL